jgi:hypothetical protein
MNCLTCGVYSEFVALRRPAPLGMVNLVSVQSPRLALGRLPTNTGVGKTTSAGRFREVEVYLVEGLPAARRVSIASIRGMAAYMMGGVFEQEKRNLREDWIWTAPPDDYGDLDPMACRC